MLCLLKRLGSLAPHLHRSSFRNAAFALCSASVLAFAANLARAQQTPTPYTAEQCDGIRSNILGIFKRYSGRISEELVADLQEFSRKGCDRAVQVRTVPGTADSDAVGELKVLIAARLSPNTRPAPR